MKYTTKIGNDYVTLEQEDLDVIAPKSFKETISTWIIAMIFCFITLGIVFGLNELLMWLFPC